MTTNDFFVLLANRYLGLRARNQYIVHFKQPMRVAGKLLLLVECLPLLPIVAVDV